MVSQHPAKFGIYRHCGSEDILVLVFSVMLQEQVIKGLCDFIDFSLSHDLTRSHDQRVM